MLQTLHIHQFVTLENLSLDFCPGFTALTGETGAGKSILLDALGLLLGDRADARFVRTGAEQADISAEFDIDQLPQVQAYLEEQMLDGDGLILRRVIRQDGRSKAFINGQAATLKDLQYLGEQLVEIQGQHQHQRLLNPQTQLDLLDRFGQHQRQVENVKIAYQNWQKALNNHQAWQDAQAQMQKQRTLLDEHITRLNRLSPQPDEFTLLMQSFESLTHQADRLRCAAQIVELLSESDFALLSQISTLEDALQEMGNYGQNPHNWLNQLASAQAELEDLLSQIQPLTQADDINPAEIAAMDERLAELNRAAKNLNIPAEDLYHHWQKLLMEYQALDEPALQEATLLKAIAQSQQYYEQQALTLSQMRQSTASQLAKVIQQELPSLGLPHAQFLFELIPCPPSSKGSEKGEMRFSANPGQALQALNQVASGGELSRISLVIQVTLAQANQTPTLIFDEVDVGIGGGIAQVVGQKMRQLGRVCQVLSVTHQGQAAACAHQHLLVEKTQTQNTTVTQVRLLNVEERRAEIARMVGGQTLTSTSLEHAQELLNACQEG